MNDEILNNIRCFDSEGNVIKLELNKEQIKIVKEQFERSFDEKIKTYIENNPDEFKELFIANTDAQFEKLFPKTYIEPIKEQSIERFKKEKVMGAVRYTLAYPNNMKDKLPSKYVNNGKFKTLLVFNNYDNILELIINKENKKIKQPKQEISKRIDNAKKFSIFINTSGKEKETKKGIYIPVNEDILVYVPKELYKRIDNRIEILNNFSNKGILSEYKIDSNENTKQWTSRLTLDEFYHKYYKSYEIQMEKEVMT